VELEWQGRPTPIIAASIGRPVLRRRAACRAARGLRAARRDVGHPGLGDAEQVERRDQHGAPLLAGRADDPLVTDEPEVDDLRDRRNRERR
jgi:hypothetical protein